MVKLGHGLHRRCDVIEEGAVALAQVVQAGVAGGGGEEARLGATAVADEAHFAVAAVLRQLVAFVGAEAALSTERAYVARTLPVGLGRRIARTVLLALASARQIIAISTSLALVASGYLRGAMTVRLGRARP